MWYLPVAIVCGLIAMAILMAKGVEWWIGLLLGMFGPGAIIIALIVKRGAGQVPIAPPAPGSQWAPDPTRRHEQRLWDGHQWTGHVSDRGISGFDPLR